MGFKRLKRKYQNTKKMTKKYCFFVKKKVKGEIKKIELAVYKRGAGRKNKQKKDNETTHLRDQGKSKLGYLLPLSCVASSLPVGFGPDSHKPPDDTLTT